MYLAFDNIMYPVPCTLRGHVYSQCHTQTLQVVAARCWNTPGVYIFVSDYQRVSFERPQAVAYSIWDEVEHDGIEVSLGLT